MLVFASFITLMALTFAFKKSRYAALHRDASTWLLDAAGLLIQGVAIPVLQISVVYECFAFLLPQAKGTLDLHPAGAFLINFVFVDYLYYWNHRLLHTAGLWRIHAVHHTAEHLDLFITSRNS